MPLSSKSLVLSQEIQKISPDFLITCTSISYEEPPVSNGAWMCYGNTKIKWSICCFSSLQLSHTANKKSLLMLSIKGYTVCIQVYTNGQGRFFHPDIHNNSASLLPDILPSI